MACSKSARENDSRSEAWNPTPAVPLVAVFTDTATIVAGRTKPVKPESAVPVTSTGDFHISGKGVIFTQLKVIRQTPFNQVNLRFC